MQTASAARRIKIYFTQRFPATDFLYNVCLHSPVCTTGSNNYTIRDGRATSFSPWQTRLGKQYTNWDDDMHILSIIWVPNYHFITCNQCNFQCCSILSSSFLLFFLWKCNCWCDKDLDNKNQSTVHTKFEHPHKVPSPACHVSKHDFHTTLSTITATTTTMTTTLASASLSLCFVVVVKLSQLSLAKSVEQQGRWRFCKGNVWGEQLHVQRMLNGFHSVTNFINFIEFLAKL